MFVECLHDSPVQFAVFALSVFFFVLVFALLLLPLLDFSALFFLVVVFFFCDFSPEDFFADFFSVTVFFDADDFLFTCGEESFDFLLESFDDDVSLFFVLLLAAPFARQ